MGNKVYIVLLNYNGSNDTIECLESVLKLDHDNFQVLVVDNSPSGQPLEQLKEWAEGKAGTIATNFKELVYPLEQKPISHLIVRQDDSLLSSHDDKVIFIKANENRGFAAGNNVALRYILKFGENNSFVWLLNNDTVVTRDCLRHLISYSDASPKTGILGNKLLYYHNLDCIQGVGGNFNTFTFIPGHIGEGLNADTAKESLQLIDYPIGASMFISYKFLDEVGMLNEDYFLYYEELDWAYRARNMGYTIDWCPDAVVYHKEGGTIGTSSDYKKKSRLSDIEAFKSRKKFYSNFFPFRPSFYFFSLLIILNRFKRGQFKRGLDFFDILLFTKGNKQYYTKSNGQ